MRQVLILIVSLAGAAVVEAEEAVAQRVVESKSVVAPLLKRYCADCHGERNPEADLTLPMAAGSALDGADVAVWKRVYEQLENGQMPPEEADQPTSVERRQLLTWLKRALTDAGVYVDPFKLLSPVRGNWVNHETLFSGRPVEATGTPDRVWRVTNTAYQQFMERVIKQFRIDVNPLTITHPWKLQPGHDFSDYSTSHRVGEAEIAVHLRNCERVAQKIWSNIKAHQTSPIKLAIEAGDSAPRSQMDGVVKTLFEKILNRPIEPAELSRYGNFLANNLKIMETDEAVEQFLIGVMFHPEVLYRLEPVEGVRAMLAPRPLARSLALTLTDREPDLLLQKAVTDGRFGSRDEVRQHVERLLNDDTVPKPRLLGFFHEYFNYTKAVDIFKCQTTLKELGIPVRGDYQPSVYVADTDRLIVSIIQEDRHVLRELLTTTRMFVLSNRTPASARFTSERKSREKAVPDFGKTGEQKLVLSTYEVSITAEDWLAYKPAMMPADHRMGVLTHPSWLIAHGTNFENHAIQRGRWIREKLLGGVVPEVPVTVNAALPDEPDQTLRTRMRVTRDAYCWKCHRLMDPLGLPFEQYDHLGRYRTAEIVVDSAATQRLKDPTKGRAMTTAPLDLSGGIELSGVPGLDGPVQTPLELIRKLADSERVEQVFVRHVFRYFLGRNETPADGPTLVAAHRAYRDHDGSLKALLVSLLTSDSFLLRTHAIEEGTQP